MNFGGFGILQHGTIIIVNHGQYTRPFQKGLYLCEGKEKVRKVGTSRVNIKYLKMYLRETISH